MPCLTCIWERGLSINAGQIVFSKMCVYFFPEVWEHCMGLVLISGLWCKPACQTSSLCLSVSTSIDFYFVFMHASNKLYIHRTWSLAVLTFGTHLDFVFPHFIFILFIVFYLEKVVGSFHFDVHPFDSVPPPLLPISHVYSSINPLASVQQLVQISSTLVYLVCSAPLFAPSNGETSVASCNFSSPPLHGHDGLYKQFQVFFHKIQQNYASSYLGLLTFLQQCKKVFAIFLINNWLVYSGALNAK